MKTFKAFLPLTFLTTLLFFSLSFDFTALAQDKPTSSTPIGQLTGSVKEKGTNEPLPGVAVSFEGTTIGALTDFNGRFNIKNVPVGSYNVKFQLVGFQTIVRFNVVITSGNAAQLNVLLEEAISSSGEVEVTGQIEKRLSSPTVLESPNSIQNLTVEEIRSNPGGNFDISRVVQALPGVGGAAGTGGGFRNDIIIRGGAPNENVFYLDGIEIPVINHFQTQGSAGGPAGILNVSFIEDVTLNSSAFHARYDNAMSSVFQFRQREGNPDKVQGNLRLSASEFAATFDGPLGKGEKTTFLASGRRSYLQFLFQAIDLPIRPNYWDFQYKITHKLTPKTTISSLGVGAIDEFTFGIPRNSTPEKEYAIRSVPTVNQWNYTVGVSSKTQLENGNLTMALSRNMFSNALDRFRDMSTREEDRTLKIRSFEIENKFRAEVTQAKNGWKYNYGLVGQWVRFTNNLFTEVSRVPQVNINYNTDLSFARYGFFGQVSRLFLDNRLGLSFGTRVDGNNFTTTGNNLLETFSPRLSASYALNEQWNINASVGRYFKVPIYTVLGFQDEQGNFLNKDAKYLQNDHYVIGTEYLPTPGTRITVEGFYKVYNNVAVSKRTGISLANLGADFQVLGNEAVTTDGKGESYGGEFFFQQKLTKNLFATFSYTLFWTKFSGTDGVLRPSAWDNRHLVSFIGGYKLPRNWEVGAKYRLQGGSPYTPFDLDASRANYLTTGQGTLNFAELNTLRLPAFQSIDIRIDKKYNFNKWLLDLYIDITNFTAFRQPALPNYTFKRTEDNSTWQTTDGQPIVVNGANGLPIILSNDDPLVLPTIGFIIEF